MGGVAVYGDQALLARVAGSASPEAAQRVHALRAALGADGRRSIPGYVTLTVPFDALAVSESAARARIEAALAAIGPGVPAAGAGGATRTIVVPVEYGGAAGPDLDAVAALAGLSPAETVALHAGRPYRVYFLGFSPGFAYMGDLVPRLAAAASRLATPRPRVAGGSVGIAGGQTGVYPRPSPGGWRLLGRTPLCPFDPHREPPALFRQGDTVVFAPVGTSGADPGPPLRAREDDPDGILALHVLRPGLLTTIQDLGRPGHEADGVPAAGAADPLAAVLANRLVGNADGAAVLEITALGPELGAARDLEVAIAGADLGAEIDGRRLPPGLAAALPRRAVLSFRGIRAGCRAYLAVRGGIASPPVLGSRSADPLGGIGPPPLRAGGAVRAYRAPGRVGDAAGRRLREGAYALPAQDEPLVAGFVPGPQAEWFEDGWWEGERPVAPASDRVGVRLGGGAPRRRQPWEGAELLSEGNVLGAVQVPPGGAPLILGAGRPTVGGYPKPAVLCTVDAWRLAQALPGAARVRLRPVDAGWARARLAEARAVLEGPGEDAVRGG